MEQHAQLNPIELSHKVGEVLEKLDEHMRQVKRQREKLIFDSVSDQSFAKAD